VQARLLPKTLFGEKYVSLVIPPQPAGQPLAAGAVIPQDRSETARELDRVLDGLLPLLQAVEPQELATTLGSIAQGLQGRGDQLGDTLVRLQTVVSRFNTELPDLVADIRLLTPFSDSLAASAPDLLQALADLTVPLQTIAEDPEQFALLLSSVTTAADELTEFLEANSANLIALADSSRPTLETLARYSPEFPCLLEQLAGVVPLIDTAFRAGTDEPGLHITLTVTQGRGKYVPGDEPEYLDNRGPRCYPIEIPGPQCPPDGCFKDGSNHPPSAPPTLPTLQTIADMGLPNSVAEQRLVGELVAMQTGGRPSEVPNWSTLLVGPLYRGTTVNAV
jgi:virulence factor Mce-like protein